MADWLTLDDFMEAPAEAAEPPLTKFRDLPTNVVLRLGEHHTASTKYGLAHFATLTMHDGQAYTVVLPSTWERSVERYNIAMDDPRRPVYLRYRGIKELPNERTVHDYDLAQAQ